MPRASKAFSKRIDRSDAPDPSLDEYNDENAQGGAQNEQAQS